MKYFFVALLSVITLATIGNAQDVYTAAVTPTSGNSKMITEVVAASSLTKVIKGAPFSAEGISESIQTLQDGNRIVRSSTTKMYRDSEGRYRRESAGSSGGFGGTFIATPVAGATVSTYGNLASAYNFQDSISIFDPVDNVRYLLMPSSKSARRYSTQIVDRPFIISQGGTGFGTQSTPDAVKIQSELKAATATFKSTNVAPGDTQVIVAGTATISPEASKSESLGTKSFDGVEAEGSRTTTTIPAGKIGNERPIEITYERWYSKELDLTVYSRQYDPRYGEQIYRLANISRSEPDRSLFTIPSDYKVIPETPLKVYTTKPEK